MIHFGLMAAPNQKDRINPALINTFPEVGWVDPFPIEVKSGKTKKQKKALEASLKEEQEKVESMINELNDENREPKVIQSFALPNARMMFKMQRSCEGVTRKENLWIYNEDPI